MTRYTPPFTLDYAMLGKVAEIAERLGQWLQAIRDALQPQLWRNHRMRSVRSPTNHIDCPSRDGCRETVRRHVRSAQVSAS